MAKELNEEMTPEEVAEVIKRADLDEDSKVTFDDFFNIMTKKNI